MEILILVLFGITFEIFLYDGLYSFFVIFPKIILYSKNRLIGLVRREFTNGPPKTLKMVLDTSLLNSPCPLDAFSNRNDEKFVIDVSTNNLHDMKVNLNKNDCLPFYLSIYLSIN